AGPEILFVERDGRVLRVGADRSDGDELFEPLLARTLHELNAHDGVVVKEAAGIFLVRADSADDGGEVDDDVGLRLRQKARDGALLTQVVVLRPGDDDIRASARAEPLDDERAEEARAAGDD